jgi:predicted dehydrogenase
VELDGIVATVQRLQSAGASPFVMVGFNRRFAPGSRLVRERFAAVQGPINVVCRVNAGRLPHGSWVAHVDEGGGRILGEVCHFVDLCSFLAGSPIVQVSAMRSSWDVDDIVVTLRMANGGVATVAYLVHGDPAAPKERIEIFGGGAIGIIDDFRRATLSVGGRTTRLGGRFSGQDKGHVAEIQAFVTAQALGAHSPVSIASAVNATRATFAILDSLETANAVHVDLWE